MGSQYNPHGVFITLETVGYVLLNLAFLFIGIAMVRTPWRLWSAAGWVFAGGGALTLALLVFYSALIGYAWTIGSKSPRSALSGWY
jgi:hypothetical protein